MNSITCLARAVSGCVFRPVILLVALLAFTLPGASSGIAFDGFFSTHQTAPKHVKDKVSVFLQKITDEMKDTPRKAIELMRKNSPFYADNNGLQIKPYKDVMAMLAAEIKDEFELREAYLLIEQAWIRVSLRDDQEKLFTKLLVIDKTLIQKSQEQSAESYIFQIERMRDWVLGALPSMFDYQVSDRLDRRLLQFVLIEIVQSILDKKMVPDAEERLRNAVYAKVDEEIARDRQSQSDPKKQEVAETRLKRQAQDFISLVILALKDVGEAAQGDLKKEEDTTRLLKNIFDLNTVLKPKGLYIQALDKYFGDGLSKHGELLSVLRVYYLHNQKIVLANGQDRIPVGIWDAVETRFVKEYRRNNISLFGLTEKYGFILQKPGVFRDRILIRSNSIGTNIKHPKRSYLWETIFKGMYQNEYFVDQIALHEANHAYRSKRGLSKLATSDEEILSRIIEVGQGPLDPKMPLGGFVITTTDEKENKIVLRTVEQDDPGLMSEVKILGKLITMYQIVKLNQTASHESIGELIGFILSPEFQNVHISIMNRLFYEITQQPVPIFEIEGKKNTTKEVRDILVNYLKQAVARGVTLEKMLQKKDNDLRQELIKISKADFYLIAFNDLAITFGIMGITREKSSEGVFTQQHLKQALKILYPTEIQTFDNKDSETTDILLPIEEKPKATNPGSSSMIEDMTIRSVAHSFCKPLPCHEATWTSELLAA